MGETEVIGGVMMMMMMENIKRGKWHNYKQVSK